MYFMNVMLHYFHVTLIQEHMHHLNGVKILFQNRAKKVGNGDYVKMCLENNNNLSLADKRRLNRLDYCR